MNRDLEAFIEEARKAAALASNGAPASSSASSDAHAQAAAARDSSAYLFSDSLERIIAIAQHCLEEETGAFRHSIQAVVDQLEELRRGCASREARGWATRLLFILTRCSRLVATEEGSLFGSGGGAEASGIVASRGGSAHGGSAYMTVQPRSKGPGRLRRFSGFPMLRGQLSLDPRGGAPRLGAALPVSPRASASPLLRSATAPSRSFKDLVTGMHHLHIHGGEGAGHKQQLSPMPESPSMVASPASASASSPDCLSTPSHAVRQVGLSPLGRSVVTALEAELEQAAARQTASAEQEQLQRVQEDDESEPGSDQRKAAAAQQQVQWRDSTPARPSSSGAASPLASGSPSKRPNLFTILKARFQSLRSSSKEPRPAAAADGTDSPRSAGTGSTEKAALSSAGTAAAAAAAATAVARQQEDQQEYIQHPLHVPSAPLSAQRNGSTRRAMSADVEGIGGSARRLRRQHPGLQKALTLQVEVCGSPLAGTASPLGASPRQVVCRICEEPVAREALQRHSRVCATLEAVCKQVTPPCVWVGQRRGVTPSWRLLTPSTCSATSLYPFKLPVATRGHQRFRQSMPPVCALRQPTQGGDVDARLTRLGNLAEEQLSSPALDAADFESLEDLVAACRQVASLQPDGTWQPVLRCEAVAALLQGMLEQGQAAAAALGMVVGAGPPRDELGFGSNGSGSCDRGLSPEADAYTQRVLHLVRCKLAELRIAVPGRMSDAGSGACRWVGGQLRAGRVARGPHIADQLSSLPTLLPACAATSWQPPFL